MRTLLTIAIITLCGACGSLQSGTSSWCFEYDYDPDVDYYRCYSQKKQCDEAEVKWREEKPWYPVEQSCTLHPARK